MTTATRGRQLNKPATMTTTYAFDALSNNLYVTVTHGIAQSFSRAVDPRANKAARAWWLAAGSSFGVRAMSCYDGVYGHDTDGDRTRSTIVYRVTR